MFYSGRTLSAGLGEHLQIGTQSYCLANGNITFSLAEGNSIFTDRQHSWSVSGGQGNGVAERSREGTGIDEAAFLIVLNFSRVSVI